MGCVGYFSADVLPPNVVMNVRLDVIDYRGAEV